MKRKRIVLGWARAGIACPDHVATQRVGPLDILLVDADRGTDARARLLWQVRCFDFGMDFLPVAPSIAMSENAGRATAKDEVKVLEDRLDYLEGLGQLTLSATWRAHSNPIQVKPTGREWLATKSQNLKRDKTARQTATAFFDLLKTTGFETQNWNRDQCVERDILLPRSKLAALTALIHTHATTSDAHTFKLSVTGLWPPYRFVQTPANPMGAFA